MIVATVAYTQTTDVVTDAIRRIRAVGLPFREDPPVQPSLKNGLQGMPELPSDPTLLSDEEVMQLFFAFTEWTSYAESALWVAQCDEGDAETRASRTRNDALLAAVGARTVTEKKNAAANSVDVVKAEDELYAQSCLRRGLEAVYHRCERNAAAMSRELSRRGTRATTDRRASKWGA